MPENILQSRDSRYLVVPELSSKRRLLPELLLSGIHYYRLHHLDGFGAQRRAHFIAAISAGVWHCHPDPNPDPERLQ